MKLIAVPARLVVGLLACVLAAAPLFALTPGGAAALRAHPAANSGIELRATGLGHASKKTAVHLRDLAAAGGKAPAGRQATASAVTTAARSALAPPAAAAAGAGASTAPPSAISANFPGLSQVDGTTPPDASAAMSPTQIVEVVNQRLQVYNRNGGAACATINLNDFFNQTPGVETLTEPRVIYDNARGKFTVMMAVKEAPPIPGQPHLPLVELLKVAHNVTGDACGDWFKYTLQASISALNIQDGDAVFVDEPVIGQDPDLLLFGGALYYSNGTFNSFVALSYPKNCAYASNCSTSFTVLHPFHFAAPTSSTVSPGYYVASVPGAGYELYRMDDNGITLTFQASIASAQSVMPPPRDAGQPGTSNRIDLHAAHPDLSTRITSSPAFDGTRIWFTHQTASGSHPSVRYGAINPASNTVTTEIAYHNATSDDFNPSIAVGINGASRTIFLNWAYSDVAGGMPVTPTVAAVTIASNDPPPPVIGKDITLFPGGITSDDRYGDYSSVAVDPRSPSQVCAVTAQEYFDFATNGKWATRISLFGVPGC